MKSFNKNLVFRSLFGCLMVVASIAIAGRVPYLTREGEWSIGIYTGQSPLNLGPPRIAVNPVLSAADVTDVPAKFVADPFMIKKDSTWYMFFEVLNAQNGRGEIGFATSKDGLQWTYGKIILRESFHLSYPHVFKFHDDYYMIPESGQAYSIRLYKSVDFPTRWEFVTSLLSGKNYSDSTVFQHEKKWWLFTGPRPYVDDTLSLYYADNLEGPWREHPNSPVVTENPHISRPAGRVVIFGDRLFRYGQDDYPNYGTQVWAFEIVELTVSSYRERKASDFPIIKAGREDWNEKGMHHIDAHWVRGNEWIASVDGFQRRWALRFLRW